MRDAAVHRPLDTCTLATRAHARVKVLTPSPSPPHPHPPLHTHPHPPSPSHPLTLSPHREKDTEVARADLRRRVFEEFGEGIPTRVSVRTRRRVFEDLAMLNHCAGLFACARQGAHLLRTQRLRWLLHAAVSPSPLGSRARVCRVRAVDPRIPS